MMMSKHVLPTPANGQQRASLKAEHRSHALAVRCGFSFVAAFA
jgi:hypothetical protein